MVTNRTVQRLITWKNSFRRLSEEYETASKKKQALDTLLNTGRISHATHDLFNMEIAEALADIEKQQKALLQKMNTNAIELEEQTKTLEILLANLEIQHVTNEIDEEIYRRQTDVLSNGIENARRELDEIREAAIQIRNGTIFVQQETEPRILEDEVAKERDEANEKGFPPTDTEAPKTAEASQSAETMTGEHEQEAKQ